MELKTMFRAAQEEEEIIPVPYDLHAEILHRLPSNDLLNFKLVCKDWNLLISSPEFIQKHLERSKTGRNEPRILIPSGRHSTEVLDGANMGNPGKEIPFRFQHDDGVRCLGSCDGLVLYYDHSIGRIGALNPCTGKRHEVRGSRPNESVQRDVKNVLKFTNTWFGRHPSTGEYVLVGLVQNEHITFEVYSLSHGSLLSLSTKEVASNTVFISSQVIATFSHGRLYIPGAYFHSGNLEPVILTYDFRTNEISTALVPPGDVCIPAFGVVNDGSLCGISKSKDGEVFEVWVMKDESWTKFGKIEGYGYARTLCPLAFCGNGDVILDDWSGNVTRYSFKDEATLRKCRLRPYCRAYVVCVDSLVSPAGLLSLD